MVDVAAADAEAREELVVVAEEGRISAVGAGARAGVWT